MVPSEATFGICAGPRQVLTMRGRDGARKGTEVTLAQERLIRSLAYERAHERLRARADELRGLLKREDAAVVALTESEVDECLSQHPADIGAILELAESAMSERERARRELGLVAQALERVAAGTYGVCEECGVAIAPGRLDVLPYASRCVECERSFERMRSLGRRAAP